MQQYLNNHRNHVRAQAKIAADEAAAANVDPDTGGPSTTAPDPGDGRSDGGDQDRNESDISISDVDDD